jgi:hypothetical protein
MTQTQFDDAARQYESRTDDEQATICPGCPGLDECGECVREEKEVEK